MPATATRTVSNRNYDYDQYETFKVWKPESHSSQPTSYTVYAHGSTLHTKVATCPKNTTLYFYGINEETLDGVGLTTNNQRPIARVQQGKSQIADYNADGSVSWRNAMLDERQKYMGAIAPGNYRDVRLSHNPHNDVPAVLDNFNASKTAEAAQSALSIPDSRRGIVSIEPMKTTSLSSIVSGLQPAGNGGALEIHFYVGRGK